MPLSFPPLSRPMGKCWRLEVGEAITVFVGAFASHVIMMQHTSQASSVCKTAWPQSFYLSTLLFTVHLLASAGLLQNRRKCHAVTVFLSTIVSATELIVIVCSYSYSCHSNKGSSCIREIKKTFLLMESFFCCEGWKGREKKEGREVYREQERLVYRVNPIDRETRQ